MQLINRVPVDPPNEADSRLISAVHDLLHAARNALDVLSDIDEAEMARLRGRADVAIDALRRALQRTTNAL